jgi:hypothetical protein
MIAIKANIIDNLESKINQFDAFKATLLDNSADEVSSSHRLKSCDLAMEDIKTKIFGRKMRDHQKVLEEEKQNLQTYLRRTKMANQMMLSGLVQPGQLSQHDRFCDFFSIESMSHGVKKAHFMANHEAVFISRFAAGYFLRHHSAKLAIRNFLYPLLGGLNKSDTSIWNKFECVPNGIKSTTFVNRNWFDTPIWNKFVTFVCYLE